MDREQPMTPEQLARFDAASNHPYECGCELCKEWWAQMPPEDDDIEDDSPYCECGNQPTEEEDASGICDACGKEL